MRATRAAVFTPFGGQQRDPACACRKGMLTEMTTSGRCIVTPTLASRRPVPSFRLFQIPAPYACRKWRPARHAARLNPHRRKRGAGGGHGNEGGQRERTCALLAAPAEPEHALSLRPGTPRDLARECRDGHDDSAIPCEGMLTAGCDGWTDRCSASDRSAWYG